MSELPRTRERVRPAVDFTLDKYRAFSLTELRLLRAHLGGSLVGQSPGEERRRVMLAEQVQRAIEYRGFD